MSYKSLDEVCGMDEISKLEVENSDKLVLKSVKDGKEKTLISIVPKDKKVLAFKTAALIAGTDYEFAVKEKG